MDPELEADVRFVRRIVSALSWSAFFGFVAWLVWFGVILLGSKGNASTRAACANNLKQIGLAFRIYSDESRGELYPVLSAQPGRLAADYRAIYPKYVPDPLINLCPATADFKTLARRTADDWRNTESVQLAFDDRSFFYLGYAVMDEEGVESYAAAYRKTVAAGEPFGTKDVNAGNTVLGPDRGTYRLREGIERFWMINDPNPGDRQRIMSRIPLLIERPLHHDHKRGSQVIRGGHVLYLDGHVEFIEYPGKWPMTEKTIAILNELDALGRAKPAPNQD